MDDVQNGVKKRFLAVFLICTFILSCSFIQAFAATAEETAYKNELKAAGFPELYLEKLWQMHQAHPNWVFKAYDTGLDWDTAVATQSAGKKNLVYIQPNDDHTAPSNYSATRLYRSQSVGEYTSKSGFDYDYVIRDGSDANQKGWVDATPMAVAYYMNPYTFIGSDITILQYESLEWNFGDSITEAEAVVETMLTGTFMSKTANSYNSNYVSNGTIIYKDTEGKTVATDITYANAICTAAKANNINPCYLTAKILGEVGTKGSGSVTGTYSGYAGYYNYLNIGASDSGSGEAVAKGLARAKTEGWTSPQLAISGGAKFIASSYIAKDQNTSYFQKFNVTKNNTYNNQYMTAVNGVVNTTYNTYSGYKSYGILDSAKTFYIPVFKNMPDGTSGLVKFQGYTNVGTANSNVNVRAKAGKDYDKSGSVTAGKSVTVYGGYRDQRVAYDSAYRTDATFYRMYTPLWYKIDSGYVCEDYLDVAASETLVKGKTLQLKCTVDSGTEKPRFMTMDTRIATVNANGVVTAVKSGTTKVVAYLTNGSFAVLNLTVTETAPSGIPTAITSKTYSVNNTSSFISKVAAGTTVSTLTSGINEKNYIKVTKDGKAMAATDTVSTGCVVSIMNGTSVVKSYTVIVTGDINIKNTSADGKISITDLLAVRDELLSGKGILTGANYKAADTDGNGKITISDLLKIRDHLLGTSKISALAY